MRVGFKKKTATNKGLTDHGTGVAAGRHVGRVCGGGQGQRQRRTGVGQRRHRRRRRRHRRRRRRRRRQIRIGVVAVPDRVQELGDDGNYRLKNKTHVMKSSVNKTNKSR